MAPRLLLRRLTAHAATRTDEKEGHTMIRATKTSNWRTGLVLAAAIAGSLGAREAAAASGPSCVYLGCQYWTATYRTTYVRTGATRWETTAQRCGFQDNWFYCNGQWMGHYLPNNGGAGWWWYKTVGGDWYKMYSARNQYQGWYFQPYGATSIPIRVDVTLGYSSGTSSAVSIPVNVGGIHDYSREASRSVSVSAAVNDPGGHCTNAWCDYLEAGARAILLGR
jgi:hypothetical protein